MTQNENTKVNGVVFPLQYDSSTHRFEVVLFDDVLDILQSLFFTAEKFVNGTELHSITGHKFAEVESFRDLYLLDDQTECLKLNIRELHLLNVIVNPVAGYQPSAGHKFQNPYDLLDSQQEDQLQTLAKDLKRIFEIIRWVPGPSYL